MSHSSWMIMEVSGKLSMEFEFRMVYMMTVLDEQIINVEILSTKTRLFAEIFFS